MDRYIFVDTWAWLAMSNRKDTHHEVAKREYEKIKIEDNKIRLEKITRGRFEAAWSLRKKYQDKPDISFTDFTSFALMHELRVNKVFTGDSHFEEVNLGFEILPKEQQRV